MWFRIINNIISYSCFVYFLTIISIVNYGCQSVVMIGGNDVVAREFKLNYGIYITEVRIIDENKFDSRPYMIGGIDSLKAKLWYPEIPKRANISGDVVIEFDIDEDGKTKSFEVISNPWGGLTQKQLENSNPERDSIVRVAATPFDKIVIDAITNTEFIPAIKNNDYLKSRIRVTVIFYSYSIRIK